jgi:pimeloyl-ACP methyl ester carboxylesterase/DNA-binding CsgD family transcriptional regulator
VKQQIRFCKARDGVTLAYGTAGAGPPLVKTANWLSHLEHDWRTPLWKPFLERLARGHTLIRYDQRGCGLSDWHAEDLSFAAWLDDLEAVVDACGVQRFALLGISQGGPLAIAYAVRHPERVSRLVLYGAYARGQLRRGPEQRDEVETMMRLIRIGWGRENPAYRQVFASLFIPDAALSQLRGFTELQRVSTSAANAEQIVATFSSIDVRELAPQVSVPTLVVHVRGDARVPIDEGRLLATLIPNAELVTVEGRNHVLLPGDAAFDQVSDAIERFLSTAPSARPLPGPLTRREQDVLELVARGLDNASIAEHLSISGKTVRNHITNIFAKLGVAHRPQAIVMAREAGLGRHEERDR